MLTEKIQWCSACILLEHDIRRWDCGKMQSHTGAHSLQRDKTICIWGENDDVIREFRQEWKKIYRGEIKSIIVNGVRYADHPKTHNYPRHDKPL